MRAMKLENQTQGKETFHVPVLLERVLETLALRPGMRVVDATLGGGGYTRALLERVGPSGQVMAFDWDRAAIEQFRITASREALLQTALDTKQLLLCQTSYAAIGEVLHEHHWEAADAIVADLGVSSDQLADPSRGISFQTDGPLDMRLNSNETVQAKQILNAWDEAALADLFRTYGDEPEAERIAGVVVQHRKQFPLATTTELKELIWKNVAGPRRRGKTHPATKVFQALRIAVNSERTHLERFLLAIPGVLRLGGRAAVVSFHSGEDAIVKHLFQTEIRSEKSRLTWVTKKPIVPGQDEIRLNSRARSAKLRVVEKNKN